MSRHQSHAGAPGDDWLPDLVLNIPHQRSGAYPELLDTVSINLLGQSLPQNKNTQHSRTARLIDEVSRTKERGACVLANPMAHPGRGFDLGHDTTGQNQDTFAWPGRDNSACASCSKWSLACVHAAALNAFDEHDSDSDECRAARLMQRLMYLQNQCGEPRNAPLRAQHQKRASLESPMLRRWRNQSPRQEGFSGVATAQPLPASAIKSRL